MLSKTYQFGTIIENAEPFNNEKLKGLIDTGKKVALKAPISTEKIIDILSKVGSIWMDTESLSHQKVRANLKNSGMGSSSIDLFFNEIFKFFSKSSLEKRWQVAIGNKNVSPVGLVLHVGATNTLVAGLDGLMDGLLAGNVNFYKLPAWDGGVPGIFIESIFAADEEKLLVNRLAAFYWKGGDKELESLFKTSMDRIIVWGGIDAIMSWKNNLGYSAQLISHGPKYGFGVLTEAGLAEGDLKSICKKIVLDASYWDQKACNSLQTLFIEDKITGEKLNQFLDCLQKTFQETYIDAPPVRSSNDYVDILNAREFIKAESLTSGGVKLFCPIENTWSMAFWTKWISGVVPSPLCRFLNIVSFSSFDSILQGLKDEKYWLQTMGNCTSKNEKVQLLCMAKVLGITRMCSFGDMVLATSLQPHDGGYDLAHLVNMIAE